MNLFFIFFSLFIASCSHTREQIDVIEFNEGSAFVLQDAVDVKAIIPLEAIEKSFIGYINQIQFYDDKIIVLDTFSAKSLMVFDSRGRFTGVAGSLGRGPGEYLIPISFSIDEDKNILSIYDNAGRKAINYDLDDLTYIDQTEMSHYFIKSVWLSDSVTAFFIPGGMDFSAGGQILITNDRLEPQRQFAEPTPRTRWGYDDIEYIYKTKEGNRFYRPNEGIIYTFDKNGYSPRYRIGFHRELPPDNFFVDDESSSSFFDRLLASGYVRRYNVLESSRYLSVGYSYLDEKFLGLYDKNNHESRLARTGGSDDGVARLPAPVATWGDSFVSVINPGSTSPDFVHEHLRSEAADNGNPVLVIYDFIATP